MIKLDPVEFFLGVSKWTLATLWFLLKMIYPYLLVLIGIYALKVFLARRKK